jgi:hypothetical protein
MLGTGSLLCSAGDDGKVDRRLGRRRGEQPKVEMAGCRR